MPRADGSLTCPHTTISWYHVRMADLRKRVEKCPPRPGRIEDIETIPDPVQRAVAAEAFVAYTTFRRSQGVRVRNAAMREATQSRSARELAEAMGKNLNSVRVICK